MHILLISAFLSIAHSMNLPLSGVDLLNKPMTITRGKLGNVIVFVSSRCPCSNSHLPYLQQLSNKYSDFQFTLVHSNQDEPNLEARNYFANSKIPVLDDKEAHLANELMASKTPHAFVLDANGRILYQGGVTNSSLFQTAKTFFLEDALKDIRASRPVEIPEGRTLGCVISRSK